MFEDLITENQRSPNDIADRNVVNIRVLMKVKVFLKKNPLKFEDKV